MKHNKDTENMHSQYPGCLLMGESAFLAHPGEHAILDYSRPQQAAVTQIHSESKKTLQSI